MHINEELEHKTCFLCKVYFTNSGQGSSPIVLGDETKQNLMEMVDKQKHKQVFRQVVDTHH